MDKKRTAALLLSLSYLGFVSLGLPDGLLGVAWPFVRRTFSLPVDALGALLVTSTTGYVLSSFTSGRLLRRMSIGTLLALSCALTSTSLLGYATAPAWPVMVALGVLAGLGAGAIDTGINTYVASAHSARPLNLLHAFYGLGTTAGPILMTSVLTAGLPWQRGYALVGAAQLLLAITFAATRRLWTRPSTDGRTHERGAPALQTLRLRPSQLNVLAFFCYVGIEAGAGAWIYTLLKEGRGQSMSAAGASASMFWGGLMLGRVLAAMLPVGAYPRVLVRACAIGVGVSALALAANAGTVPDAIAVALLGCACGPIFPSLIAMTPARVGSEHSANAIGFQIAAAAVGQSLLPALIGVLADARGLETIASSLVVLSVALMVVYRVLERTPQPQRPLTQALADAPR